MVAVPDNDFLRLPSSLERAERFRAYSAEPQRLKPGNQLIPLCDGEEIFPAMLRAIAQARRYVHLETYILRDDTVGRLFAGAMIERALQGVSVRLLFDGFGAFSLSRQYVEELEAAGVQVAIFRARARRWDWRIFMRRDHRKILVVDGTSGFLGGVNLADDYAPRKIGGKGWRECHVEVRGPVVADLDQLFGLTWTRAGGAPYARPPRVADEAVAVPGSELASVLAIDDRGQRSTIRRHLVHALRSARDYVYITNAYFIPDRGIRRALRRAVRRGIDVKIIVPSNSDVAVVQWAGEHTYAELLRSGVRLYQWPITHVHAKTFVVDGVWSMIGSYNLDYVSLFMNMEVVVEVIGEETGGRMREIFCRDVERCHEIVRREWARRSWLRRLLEWLFYRFRRML